MEKLYVNKNLTQRRKKLLWQTKQAAKKGITITSGRITAKSTYAKMKKATKYILKVKLTWTICSELCEFNYFCLDF